MIEVNDQSMPPAGSAMFAEDLLATCWTTAGDASPTRDVRDSVKGLAPGVLVASGLLIFAGTQDGPLQAALWVIALVLDFLAPVMSGMEGWTLEPSHFVERYGLIVIIALGESIVALGVGAGHLELTVGVIAGALSGIAVAGAMWWAYFDVVAIVAERRLRAANLHDRVLIARDSYTYLHLPMVAGVIIFAIGVKETLAGVDEQLDAVPAVALCGGVALYLLALSAFKRRNVGSFNVPRLVAASALAALAPLALVLPALLSLALVALVACTLIAFEVFQAQRPATCFERAARTESNSPGKRASRSVRRRQVSFDVPTLR